MEGAKALRLDDDVRVKVALLPVGNTSLTLFQHLAGVLAGITEVELGAIDPDSLPSAGSTAFPCKTGVWDGSQLRIAYADSILQASPWDTLQASRQVMAVIGVCCCAENLDLMRAWESFLIEVQHSHVLRSSLAVHCLAFNPVHGQEGMAGGQWGNTLHCITGSDPEDMGEQIRAVLMQVAGEVVHGLEQLIVTAEGYLPNLITPNDGGDAKDPKVRLKRGPGRVCKRQADLCLLASCPQDAILRYRMSVELSRSCGDHLWLAAALEGLAAAVSRADPDNSAASAEVLASSLSSLSLSSSSLSEISRKVPQASATLGRNLALASSGVSSSHPLVADSTDKLGECLLEAAALYDKRKVQVLQSEALLRYARHLAGAPGSQCAGGRLKEVWVVMAKVEALLGSLQAADQVMVLGAMAKLCEDLQCRRKVAYYVYRAVRTHVNCSQWALAHDSMLLVAAYCGLDARHLEPSRTVAGILAPQTTGPRLAFQRSTLARQGGACIHGSQRGQRGEGWGWFSLQATVVGDLMHFAQMLGDDARAARYYSFWLSRVASAAHSRAWLQGAGEAEAAAAVRQRILLNQLLYRSSVFLGSLALPAPGGAILRSISVFLPPTAPRVIENPGKRGGAAAGGLGGAGRRKGEDVFLYCAFAEKSSLGELGRGREGVALVVEGEVVKVRLLLENPFHVALPIEYLSLVTEADEGGSAVPPDCSAVGEAASEGGGGAASRDAGGRGAGKHGCLRLVPKSVELPPRPADTQLDVHARVNDPSRGARAEVCRVDNAYEVLLDAVVMAPAAGSGERRQLARDDTHVARLCGCKVRLWNVIFELEALNSPLVGLKRGSAQGGSVGKPPPRREHAQGQALYRTLPQVPLVSMRCHPKVLPREMASGQVFRGCLRVENSGSVPISWFRVAPSFAFVTAGPSHDRSVDKDQGPPHEGKAERVVVYDASELLASLPLAPGEKAHIPLWICPPPPDEAHGGGSGMAGREMRVGLKLLYGRAEADEFWRGSEWSVSTRVFPSLTVRSIRIAPGNPCDHTAKVRLRDTAARDAVQSGGGGGGICRAGGGGASVGCKGAAQEGAESARRLGKILPHFVTNKSYAFSMPAEGVRAVCIDDAWAGAHESTLEITISNHTTLPYSLVCGGDTAAGADELRRDGGAAAGSRSEDGEHEALGLLVSSAAGSGGDQRYVRVIEGRSTMRVRVPFVRFELSSGDAEEAVPADWMPEVGQRALSFQERKAAAAQEYAGRYRHALLSRLRFWWVSAAGKSAGGDWVRDHNWAGPGLSGGDATFREGGEWDRTGGDAPDTHAYGLLFWDGCPLPREAVRHIRAPDVWVRGRLVDENGAEDSGVEGAVLLVGEFVRVEVTVGNLSQQPLSALTLQIFQSGDDNDNGGEPPVATLRDQVGGSRPLDGRREGQGVRVAFSGVLDNALPCLSPGATFRSEFGVCALDPGYLTLAARVRSDGSASLVECRFLHVMVA